MWFRRSVFKYLVFLTILIFILWSLGLLGIDVKEVNRVGLLAMTPLALAAAGECINQKAGVINIGIEGIFLISCAIGVYGAERLFVSGGIGGYAGGGIGVLAAFSVVRKLGKLTKPVAATIGALPGAMLGYAILPGLAGILAGAIVTIIFVLLARTVKLVTAFVGIPAGAVIGHGVLPFMTGKLGLEITVFLVGGLIGILAAFILAGKFGGLTKPVAATIGALPGAMLGYAILPLVIETIGVGLAGFLVGSMITVLVVLALAVKLAVAFVSGLSGFIWGFFIMAIVAATLGFGVAGLLSGALIGAFIGLVLGLMSTYGKGHQVVAGMGINVVGMGLIAFLLMAIWAFPGIHLVRDEYLVAKISTPIGLLSPVVFVAIIVPIVAHIFLHKTLFGLRIKAAGEKPESVDVAGINVNWIRIFTPMLGGALAGLGGTYMALGWFDGIVKEITAGRGFIALACVVVAGLSPLLSLATAYIFGFAEGLAFVVMVMPAIKQYPFLPYFFLMFPYIVVLIVVTIFLGRRRFPSALGKPYIRE